MSFLPPLPLARGWIVRGVLLWGMVHLFAAFVGVLLLSPAQAVFLAAVVYLAARADDRARRDDLLVADLGVNPLLGPAVSAVAAVATEAAVQVGLGAAGSPV